MRCYFGHISSVRGQLGNLRYDVAKSTCEEPTFFDEKNHWMDGITTYIYLPFWNRNVDAFLSGRGV